MEHQHKYNSGQIMEIRRFSDITAGQGDRNQRNATSKSLQVEVFWVPL